MARHVYSWREARRSGIQGEEFDFRRRQFRRRMQTSAMLGLSAVAVLLGQYLREPPLLVLIFWIGVLLLVFWVVLLALVDIWATKRHFGRLRQAYLSNEAKLQAEIHHLRAARGNGKANPRKPEAEET